MKTIKMKINPRKKHSSEKLEISLIKPKKI
jgi:hypothetical protein